MRKLNRIFWDLANSMKIVRDNVSYFAFNHITVPENAGYYEDDHADALGDINFDHFISFRAS